MALVWIMVPGVGGHCQYSASVLMWAGGSVLQWAIEAQKRLVHDLLVHGGCRGGIVPMVLLGLFSGFLGHCIKVSHHGLAGLNSAQ